MDREFKQEELEQILHTISEHISRPINIYLFGGAVMVYNNLKPATKDIDILFEETLDYNEFLNAAKPALFFTKSIPIEYNKFYMATMLQNPQTNWRLDLFLRKVCGKFCFNLDVKKRSKFFVFV